MALLSGADKAATIHSELFALNNGRRHWDDKTVVVVDEAAMLDTKLMAMVTTHAADAGAKLILSAMTGSFPASIGAGCSAHSPTGSVRLR